MGEILNYIQATSAVNPSFWSKLSELKLNVDKLEDTSRNIWGYFTNLNKDCLNPILEVDSTSFNEDFNDQKIYIPFSGKIYNKNTIEEFKGCDKTNLINNEGECLLESIKSGDVLENPSLLNTFLILSFADLKKYHYYYWFSFPVLKELTIKKESVKPLTEDLSDDLITQLNEVFVSLSAKNKTYFIVERVENKIQIHSLKDKILEITVNNYNKFHFAFYNISNKSGVPGSQLRNYIAFILHYCPFLQEKSVSFLEFNLSRKESKVTCKTSTLYNLILPRTDSFGKNWVGWEKNERDKMGPRFANMKNTLDPHKLADDAVDLNLKLMKWRILDKLDLEIIKNSKCLLLGSGTLGCSVARALLGWGVRNITLVDNSTVSFSNPVRQSLFTFQDSVDMKPKSEAAAENLKKIFPGVNSRGFQINIPMPGHSVGESMLQQVKSSVTQLDALVQENDILFLLMDSRESRWLPTVLGYVYNKIVINAALGFDTYLVMRHGTNQKLDQVQTETKPGIKTLYGHQLGCYFCSDIHAPGDSLKDRTLDQQCTVTRPGLSQIAGGLAVELAVSLLQHEQRNNAPAFYQMGANPNVADLESQCVLGLLPHTLRGFLSSFNHILPATQRFPNCVGCSVCVIDEYKKNGFEFLLKVFNSSKYLEDLTGLTEVLQQATDIDIDVLSDEED